MYSLPLDQNACCYIRFLIYLREIVSDIKNNKYNMSSVEHEIKHHERTSPYDGIATHHQSPALGTWYAIPYVGMTE
jgi:hypothetical protein